MQVYTKINQIKNSTEKNFENQTLGYQYFELVGPNVKILVSKVYYLFQKQLSRVNISISVNLALYDELG